MDYDSSKQQQPHQPDDAATAMETDTVDLENPPPEQANVAGKPNDQERKVKLFVYLLSMTAALGALVFGFSLTGAGGSFVMQGFQEQFGWTCAQGDVSCVPKSPGTIHLEESLTTALQSVGSLAGALFIPCVFDRIGRKWTIFSAALIFCVGAVIQTSAFVIEQLFVGRVISGFGIGMMAMSIPVYISECAPSHKRGELATFWQVGVTVGMLIGTGVNVDVANVSWGWRVSYGGNIVFAVLLMVSMVTFMPESPRYLTTKENDDDASSKEQLEQVLGKIRFEDELERSLEAIRKEVQADKELGEASWMDLWNDRPMRNRVMLGMGMQLLNQLSGNESINFYAPTILNGVFGNASLLNSFFLGIINFIAVLLALAVVDRVGRVPLWVSGGLTMMISMIAVSVLESLTPTTAVNYCFLVMLAIFTFAYHGSMGPLAWDICSEIFPVRQRAMAVGLTTMSNFVGVILVGAIFPFAQAASASATFAFFTVMLFLNICLVYFFLPETAGKSALQIEEGFRNHKPKLARKICYMAHNHKD